MNEEDIAIIHIAGPVMQIRYRVRQRCLWCGALIIDAELDKIGFVVEEGQQPPVFPTWTPGAMVYMDGHNPKVSHQVEFDPSNDSPPDRFCGNLDSDVTA